MHCLCCDETIRTEITWSNFIFASAPSKICHRCEKKMHMLQGKRCTHCSREYDGNICPDCLLWNSYYAEDDPLTYNYSLYAYNHHMKEILSRWKYRGDYQLGEIFRAPYRESFSPHFSSEAIIVPIPLSRERMKERAFNQANMLASFLPRTAHSVLIRIHHEKQSKKTRKERLKTMNPFKITKTVQKPVILVDDLYTTGVTLRHAATLLRKNGCPKVYAYTLIRA